MSHNGKRLQVNPWFLITQTEYPFLDHMKCSAHWNYADNSGFIDWAETDVNGYPTVVRNTGIRTTFSIPSQSERPGNYVIRWGGNITTLLGMANTLIEGSMSGPNGRAVFSTSATTIIFIVTVITTPITFISVCHEDDEEALFDDDEMFQPTFKAIAAEFGVFRFLDWIPANTSTITSSADWKPVAHYSYLAEQYPSQHLAGTAVSSGNVYSAVLAGFVLADKARAILKFDVDQTFTSSTVTFTNGQATIGWTGHPFSAGDRVAFDSSVVNGLPASFMDYVYYVSATNLGADSFEVSLTSGGASVVASTAGSGTHTGYSQSYLDVEGTGAKPILNIWGGFRTTTGGAAGSNAAGIKGGFWSDCVYDAGLDGYIVNNSNNATHGISNGVPPSVMIRLCNECGFHPWMVPPFLTCDAPGNLPTLPSHTADLATLCRDTLLPGLVPRFEAETNEAWNSNFIGTQYGYLREYARNGATNRVDINNWVGMVASLMGQDISAVYSDDRTKYQVICAFFTNVSAASQLARLESTAYVARGGEPAKDWVTHMAITGYWNSGYYGTAQESTWATEYASADAATKAALVESYMLGALDPDLPRFDTIPKVAIKYADFQSTAASYGLKLCQYEGDNSPDYGGDATINTFRAASKNSPLLAIYSNKNFHNFLDAGANCEFPSVYVLSGANAAWPVWDPSIYVTPAPPRWEAVLLCNAQRKRFRVNF